MNLDKYKKGWAYHRSLGIARHRAMHRDRKEDCTILDAGAGSITYCNFKEAQNDH